MALTPPDGGGLRRADFYRVTCAIRERSNSGATPSRSSPCGETCSAASDFAHLARRTRPAPPDRGRRAVSLDRTPWAAHGGAHKNPTERSVSEETGYGVRRNTVPRAPSGSVAIPALHAPDQGCPGRPAPGRSSTRFSRRGLRPAPRDPAHDPILPRGRPRWDSGLEVESSGLFRISLGPGRQAPAERDRRLPSARFPHRPAPKGRVADPGSGRIVLSPPRCPAASLDSAENRHPRSRPAESPPRFRPG